MSRTEFPFTRIELRCNDCHQTYYSSPTSTFDRKAAEHASINHHQEQCPKRKVAAQ